MKYYIWRNYINDKREENGKYILENGEYYIGQWKNGLFHVKGKEYYANGNIKYEGDFIDCGWEGNWKYISENGNYYIGQLKNGLGHGNWKENYANGNIKYEGNYINDKYVEKWKYISEKGEYYIGQWKNGLGHGNWKENYSNGNIKYKEIILMIKEKEMGNIFLKKVNIILVNRKMIIEILWLQWQYYLWRGFYWWWVGRKWKIYFGKW